MMTPRQRWLALLNQQPADRIPTDYWATGEFHAKLLARMGITASEIQQQRPNVDPVSASPQQQARSADEILWRRLGIDKPRGVGPRWKLQAHPDDPQADMWGNRHRRIEYGTGAYDEFATGPLAKMTTPDEVDSFRWPDPDDFDYSPITEALHHDDGYRIIQAGGYEPFLTYAGMRGMEQAYEDMLLDPAMVEAALKNMFAFFFEHHRRIFQAGRGHIDMTYVAEDLGGQTGPLFSLEVYRRFLLPYQKRMADLARSFGVHVFYHTDGAAHIFLPDLIGAVGIEVLNPIQWRCPGMERETLARQYGHQVVFHGAIDNQQTLPFGTAQQVAQEVRQTAEIFKSCRWICAPCHNIQAVTPVENVIAMYETAASLKSPG